MSRVVLRRFREGDEEAVNRGFHRVFGQERSIEEWRWKFPPEEGGRFVMVAEEEGEVLAHFAAVPVRMRIDGRELPVLQVVDVYAVRRSGVIVRLVHRFYEEFCGPDRRVLVYGFPGERHFRLGVLKLGYSPPLPVGYWCRGPATAPGGAWGRRLRRLRGFTVHRGPRPAAAEVLWRRSAVRYPVAMVRDGAWLERRFLGRPGVEYLHLTVEHRGEPAALAVLRLPQAEEEERVLSWAELVWGGRPAALAALDDEVARLARETGAGESRLWLAGDPAAERLLAARGWQRREHPEKLCLGAVSFHPEIDAADLCRRLYLTMGDGDLV